MVELIGAVTLCEPGGSFKDCLLNFSEAITNDTNQFGDSVRIMQTANGCLVNVARHRTAR